MNVMKLLILVVAMMLAGCPAAEKPAAKPARPLVMTTLFPLYDFARIVAGERMEVKLLLPPGLEPHHFEPRPEDVASIQRATLFVYTGPFMEPWAERILAGVDRSKVGVIQAAEGLDAGSRVKGQGSRVRGHEHDEQGGDPHVWLDFSNAGIMVQRIAAAFALSDPEGAVLYRQRAAKLVGQLAELDRRYQDGLSSCVSRTVIHGGHNAFSYLGRRYNLTYRAAAGVSAEVEPTPRRIAELVKLVRSTGSKAVFSEELVSPRIAQTISRETGAQVLKLHGAHNVGKEELASGVSFIQLMDDNLKNFRTGLGCAN